MTQEPYQDPWAQEPLGGNLFQAQIDLLGGRTVRTILDCGAHTGDMCKVYSPCFPDAAIYSFEPNPHTFEQLVDAAATLGNVTPVHAALSDREGTAELYLDEHSWADSLVRRPKPGAADQRRGAVMTVPTTTIDRFCAEEGIEHVHILKLDVEGVEFQSLRGARRLLAGAGVDLLVCELNFKPRHPDQSRASQVIEMLWEFGYRLLDLCNVQRPNRELGFGWCHGIFLPLRTHPAFTASKPQQPGDQTRS